MSHLFQSMDWRADTSVSYGTEAAVGKAIKDSKIPRSELFITTKLWNNR